MILQKSIFIHLFVAAFWISLPGLSVAQVNKRNVEQSWETDTSNARIPLNELWILLKRDGIPPVDRPVFLTREDALEVFFENEPVISVSFGEVKRAYPLSILTYHEIVNDNAGEAWFTVSYCPLCNSSVVFNRMLEFEGESYLLDFGTSGMLRKSNLVMWDRQTESWWQQITGEALSGKMTGAKLEMLPSSIISVKEFFSSYPEGRILSTETGYNRQYGSNPYENYDNLENTKPRLFDEPVNDRLPAMERVIHIFGATTPKIYPLSQIRKEKVINDRHEGQDVVLFYQDGAVSILDKKRIRESKNVGSVTVFNPVVGGQKLAFESVSEGFRDQQTGSLWSLTGKCTEGKYLDSRLRPLVYGNHFAFAWLAFYPETVIYGE